MQNNSGEGEEDSWHEHTIDDSPAAKDGDTQHAAVVAILGNALQMISEQHTAEVQALTSANTTQVQAGCRPSPKRSRPVPSSRQHSPAVETGHNNNSCECNNN